MAHEPALGDNLRRWRRRKGYSQEELAERAGVSVSVVWKLEQDDETAAQRQGVRLETLYKLARHLMSKPPNCSRHVVPSLPTGTQLSKHYCQSGSRSRHR